MQVIKTFKVKTITDFKNYLSVVTAVTANEATKEAFKLLPLNVKFGDIIKVEVKEIL